MALYLTQSDLENRLGRHKVLALYDDDNTGTVNAAALNDVLSTACGLIDGAVARNYKGEFPIQGTAPPLLLKEGALLYAMAMSIERHPEYAAQYGDRYLFLIRQQADALGARIASGLVKLVDAPNNAPGVTLTGALVFSDGPRLIGLNPNGTSNTGDL